MRRFKSLLAALPLLPVLTACSYTTTPTKLKWDNGFTTTQQTARVIDPTLMDTATTYAATCGPAAQVPPDQLLRGVWQVGENGIACKYHDDSHSAQRGLVGVVVEQGTAAAIGGWFYVDGQRARRPTSVSVNAGNNVTGGEGGSGGAGGKSSATGGTARATGGSSTAISRASAEATASLRSRYVSNITVSQPKQPLHYGGGHDKKYSPPDYTEGHKPSKGW